MENTLIRNLQELKAMQCETSQVMRCENRTEEQLQFYNGETEKGLQMIRQEFHSKSYLEKVYQVYSELFAGEGECGCCFEGRDTVHGHEYSCEKVNELLNKEQVLSEKRNELWGQYFDLLLHAEDVRSIKNDIEVAENAMIDVHYEVKYNQTKESLEFAIRTMGLLRQCIMELGVELKKSDEDWTQMSKLLDCGVEPSNGDQYVKPQLKTVVLLKTQLKNLTKECRDLQGKCDNLDQKLKQEGNQLCVIVDADDASEISDELVRPELEDVLRLKNENFQLRQKLHEANEKITSLQHQNECSETEINDMHLAHQVVLNDKQKESDEYLMDRDKYIANLKVEVEQLKMNNNKKTEEADELTAKLTATKREHEYDMSEINRKEEQLRIQEKLLTEKDRTIQELTER